MSHSPVFPLFLCLDSQLYRDALLLHFLDDHRFTLVGECQNAQQTIKTIAAARPQVLLIDEELSDSDGLTVAEYAMGQVRGLSVVLLVNGRISGNRLAIYLESGIRSVISKQQPLSELNKALAFASHQQVYISASLTSDGQGRGIDRNSLEHQHSLFLSLSAREKQVAYGLSRYWNIADIARSLKVSNKTVHTYKERIMVKLELRRLNELVLLLQRLPQPPGDGAGETLLPETDPGLAHERGFA